MRRFTRDRGRGAGACHAPLRFIVSSWELDSGLRRKDDARKSGSFARAWLAGGAADGCGGGFYCLYEAGWPDADEDNADEEEPECGP